MTSAACPPIKIQTNLLESLSQSFISDGSALIQTYNEESGSEYDSLHILKRVVQRMNPLLWGIICYKQHMIVGTLLSIEKKPKLFLGLPPRSFFLIKLLCEQAPLPTKHIYIALKKTHLNMSFSIMAVDFGLSVSTLSRVVSNTLPVLARKMQELIVWPERKYIHAHLPIPFHARYAKVESIIDCLEIEIEKPSDPVHHSLTWYNYYNCNTIKYLVSCTLDGLTAYISEGFGDRS